MTPEGLLGLLYSLPAILIALSFHEWAHAFAAFKLGDPTARNLGRMTVNPLRHIDPMGFLMLIIVGFGWAKPVPINPRNFSKPRRDEIIVSLAGITTNMLLAFVFMGLLSAMINLIGFYNEVVVTILSALVIIDIALAVFNLLPIPPLDGYRFVMCLVPRKYALRVYVFVEKYGRIIGIVLLLVMVFSGVVGTVTEWVYINMLKLFGLVVV